MISTDGLRSPAFKLFLAIVVGLALTIPLFSVWLLVYDRQTQSQEASASITAGWGGPQAMSGPVLVIPYRATATETVLQNGQSVTRSNEVMRELTLAPEIVQLSTAIRSPSSQEVDLRSGGVFVADDRHRPVRLSAGPRAHWCRSGQDGPRASGAPVRA